MAKPRKSRRKHKSWIVRALKVSADLSEAVQPYIVRIIVSAIFFYGLYRVASDVFKAHAQ